MFFEFLPVFGIVFLQNSIPAIFGFLILQYLNVLKSWHWAFKLGAGHAIGIGILYFQLLIISKYITSPTNSYYLSLLITSIFIIILFYRLEVIKCIQHFIKYFPQNKRTTIKKNILIFIALQFFIGTLITLLWMQSVDFKSPFNSFGSLHSGRYVNISEYIFQNNVIPILSQNYLQSIFSFSTFTLGKESPFFSLTCWLVQSIFFLSYIVYGFLRKFVGNKTSYTVAGTLIVMAGNSMISVKHALILDSGYPFIINGYTDTLYSLSSLLIAIIIIHEVFRDNRSLIFRILSMALLIAPVMFLWNLCGGQNFFLYLLFSIASFLFSRNQNYFILTATISLCLIALFMGRNFGGMLTPEDRLDRTNIPGLMELSKKEIMIAPGTLLYFREGIRWKATNEVPPSSIIKKTNEIHDLLSTQNIRNVFNTKQFLKSIQMFAIPSIGFFVFIAYLLRTLFVPPSNNRRNKYSKTAIGFGISIAALAGVTIYFIFAINSMKWEMSRFGAFWFLTGTMMFSIFLIRLINRMPKRVPAFIPLYLVVFFLTFPPFQTIFYYIYRNLSEDYFMSRTVDLKKDALLKFKGYVGGKNNFPD